MYPGLSSTSKKVPVRPNHQRSQNFEVPGPLVFMSRCHASRPHRIHDVHAHLQENSSANGLDSLVFDVIAHPMATTKSYNLEQVKLIDLTTLDQWRDSTSYLRLVPKYRHEIGDARSDFCIGKGILLVSRPCR